MLDFEARTWRFQASKEQAIRDEFNVKPIHYVQQLAALLERPEALAYSPMLVRRLRRRREARGRDRAGRAQPAQRRG